MVLRSAALEIDAMIYDTSSGFWFDESTGEYYDPDSGNLVNPDRNAIWSEPGTGGDLAGSTLGGTTSPFTSFSSYSAAVGIGAALATGAALMFGWPVTVPALIGYVVLGGGVGYALHDYLLGQDVASGTLPWYSTGAGSGATVMGAANTKQLLLIGGVAVVGLVALSIVLKNRR